MSIAGLDRTADALLQQRAVQATNYDRVRATMSHALRDLRSLAMAGKVHCSDIIRLSEELSALSVDYNRNNTALSHLRDGFQLQTRASNELTEAAVAYRKRFTESRDEWAGFVDRICYNIDSLNAYIEARAAHGNYLSTLRQFTTIVATMRQLRRLYLLSFVVCGHYEGTEGQPSLLSTTTSSPSSHTSIITLYTEYKRSIAAIEGQECEEENDMTSPAAATDNNKKASSPSPAATTTDSPVARYILTSSTTRWLQQISRATAASGEVSAQLAQLKQDNDTTQEDLSATTKRVEQLQQENTNTTAATEELRSQLEEQQAQLESTRCDLAKEEEALRIEKQSIEDSKQRLAELQARHAQIQQTRNEEAQAAEQRVAEVQARLGELRVSHVAALATTKAAEEAVSQLTTQLEDRWKHRRSTAKYARLLAQRFEECRSAALELRQPQEQSQAALKAAQERHVQIAAIIADAKRQCVAKQQCHAEEQERLLLTEQRERDELQAEEAQAFLCYFVVEESIHRQVTGEENRCRLAVMRDEAAAWTEVQRKSMGSLQAALKTEAETRRRAMDATKRSTLTGRPPMYPRNSTAREASICSDFSRGVSLSAATPLRMGPTSTTGSGITAALLVAHNQATAQRPQSTLVSSTQPLHNRPSVLLGGTVPHGGAKPVVFKKPLNVKRQPREESEESVVSLFRDPSVPIIMPGPTPPPVASTPHRHINANNSNNNKSSTAVGGKKMIAPTSMTVEAEDEMSLEAIVKNERTPVKAMKPATSTEGRHSGLLQVTDAGLHTPSSQSAQALAGSSSDSRRSRKTQRSHEELTPKSPDEGTVANSPSPRRPPLRRADTAPRVTRKNNTNANAHTAPRPTQHTTGGMRTPPTVTATAVSHGNRLTDNTNTLRTPNRGSHKTQKVHVQHTPPNTHGGVSVTNSLLAALGRPVQSTTPGGNRGATRNGDGNIITADLDANSEFDIFS